MSNLITDVKIVKNDKGKMVISILDKSFRDTQLPAYEGKDLIMELKKSTRSIKQNRFYWACLKIIKYYYPENSKIPNEQILHNYFKECYALTSDVKNMFTKIKGMYVCNLSTSFYLMNNEAFNKYMDFVENKCQEDTGMSFIQLKEEYINTVGLNETELKELSYERR